jgi:hypothetical protein
MRCISNIERAKHEAVLAAIEESGAAVEWRDEPDENIRDATTRVSFGSIWSAQSDLARFWAAYGRLTRQ